jgi:formate C-acetyltransferase
MAPEWLEAYEAGMFTEFQEQRAPGHTVLGTRFTAMGMLDISATSRGAIAALDFVPRPRRL